MKETAGRYVSFLCLYIWQAKFCIYSFQIGLYSSFMMLSAFISVIYATNNSSCITCKGMIYVTL